MFILHADADVFQLHAEAVVGPVSLVDCFKGRKP